jgi:hypothetical protein
LIYVYLITHLNSGFHYISGVNPNQVGIHDKAERREQARAYDNHYADRVHELPEHFPLLEKLRADVAQMLDTITVGMHSENHKRQERNGDKTH